MAVSQSTLVQEIKWQERMFLGHCIYIVAKITPFSDITIEQQNDSNQGHYKSHFTFFKYANPLRNIENLSFS